MKTTRFLLTAGIALAMALTFIGCEEIGGGKSALADRWLLVEGRARDNPEDMELLKDGTGIVDKAAITWKVESGRFYLTHPMLAASYDYKLQGSTLTLTDDKKKAVYKTKKGIEKEIEGNRSSFTDARDKKSYKTIKIGNQVWMAENLSYEAEGSKCYENKPENCSKYGRLYNWETAMKACPAGWHLPKNEEWDALYRYADGTSGTKSPYKSETAGKVLKAKEGWKDNKGKSGNGTDKYGFAALPGGGGHSDGNFYDAGSDGYWWSSSERNAYYAYNRDMYYNYEDADWYYDIKADLHSVRCLQD